MNAHQKIEAAIIALNTDKPFYAAVCYNMSRVADKNLKNAFGLFFTKRGAELKYNPDLVTMYTVNAIQYQIEHIVAHLVSLHPTRREGRDSKGWNVSTDLVVNQFVKFPSDVPDISSSAPTVEKLKLPHNRTAENYYELLEIKEQSKKSKSGDDDSTPQNGNDDQQDDNNNDEKDNNENKDNQADGQNKGNNKQNSNQPKENTVDDHSGWDNIGKEGVTKDLVQAISRSAIHNAMKSCGNIPGEFKDIIDELFSESKIDWRDILSQFVATSQLTSKAQTWKRPNRRFDDQPGFKKQVKPKLLVGIDTSGSVSDEDQKKLLNEVFNIIDQKESEVIVAGYDCRVHTIVRITSGFDNDCKIPNTNGGTDFQPLNDLAEEEEPDAVINLTDGYAPTPQEINRPYLWVFLKSHQDHPKYGESLILED